MGPRAGLDGCEKSRLHRDSIPGPSSPYRVAILTELSRPPCNKINVAKNSVGSDKIQMLGATVTDRSLVYEETERLLNSGNPCYHSGSNVIDLPFKVQNIQNWKCSGGLYGY